MPTILVATQSGCRVFQDANEGPRELVGRIVGPLRLEADGTCLTIVDTKEVWRRSADGSWSKVATAPLGLQSIVSCAGRIYCGGLEEAAIIRIPPIGPPEVLQGFEEVSGRSEWFAGGPPLGVRSLAATSDERVLLAGVHVGGIPRSEDVGS